MNKRQSISCALIILSALLFGPANALALSDLDTKFRGVKTDEQGQERHLYCDLLTITSGTLICRNGSIDDRIPLSHVKQLDVEYMGKRYVVSNINKSDIDSANAMSVKKEEAFYRQEKANQERVSNSESQSYLFGTIDSSATPNDNNFAAIAKEPEASQHEMFRKNIDKIIDADIAAHGGVSPLDRMQLPDNKEAKSETTEDIPIFVLIIFVSITWIISLTPSLLIRFIFIKRPIGKWKAIATVATLWFINIFIATALGSNGKTHWGSFFVSWASYAILRKSNKNKQSSDSSCNEHAEEKSNKNKPSPESPCDEHTKEPSIPYGIKKSLHLFGLNENSSFEDAKSAYRKCMSEYHPDKVSHLGADLRKFAEDKTKKYNIAFGIIKDYFSRAG